MYDQRREEKAGEKEVLRPQQVGKKFYGLKDQIEVHVKCVFSRAEGHFGKTGKVKKSAPKYPRYPDCDNLAKFYLDVLNKVVWHDDSSVLSLKVTKCYGKVPQTIVRVSEFKQEEQEE